MKNKILYLMCGCPASGKTTWVRNSLRCEGYENTIWCSRDVVREVMIPEDAPFDPAEEKKVFSTWIDMIQRAIYDPTKTVIYADATHCNIGSRIKTLDSLDLEGVKVVPVVMLTPLRTCLERNSKRTGRAKVPEQAICNLSDKYQSPEEDGYPYYDIIFVHN